MTILAIMLQIQILVKQIAAIKATMTAGQIAQVNWAPYDAATRTIPLSEDQAPNN